MTEVNSDFYIDFRLKSGIGASLNPNIGDPDPEINCKSLANPYCVPMAEVELADRPEATVECP